MKLIIAGGRGYQFTAHDVEMLDAILDVTEVVSGGAQGADAEGEEWAAERGIPVRTFRADWNKHGRAAGPIRNREMAEYADALALFPGGRGTDSMFREGTKAGLKIFDWRNSCITGTED
jgi:YspA, cpYpsA-related SLOG family